VEAKLLKLGPGGMFAEVNEVVCQLKLAEENGYRFVIDWQNSPYRDEASDRDPWNYFFEDCFHVGNKKVSGLLPFVGDSVDAHLNFMRPRVYRNLAKGPMQLPADRSLAHQLINKYIRPKEEIRREIERYRKEHFRTYIIGLHLRGPGRLDGGVRQLRRRHQLKHGVPFQLYFRCLDQVVDLHPEARVFVCSDSRMVIDECRGKYGEKVLTYDATRSAEGEMHQQKGRYSGCKLGRDVILEAYLLSETDYFVHGNSNVSNFVLCLNPHLPAKYVYDGDPHTSWWLNALDLLLGTRGVREAKKRVPADAGAVVRRFIGL
jgi:hypothetical protein